MQWSETQADLRARVIAALEQSATNEETSPTSDHSAELAEALRAAAAYLAASEPTG